jgi:ice-binding like protein
MKKLLLNIVTSIILFSFPTTFFAQTPTLGTAANYVIFSSNGAVGNTGISQLTGNVGTNNGAITGFGNVNGVMHNADTSTAKCAADLQVAYDTLNNKIPNFFRAPLLGNGDTLIAGVYMIAGISTLDSILYLNAEGNSNAVFVFQLQAAFSTSPNSKVVLLNGAQACNVFWKVEGLVSMGTSTVMKGTVIAHNAAINMTTNDTLEGRALAIAGAVTVNGVLAFTPTGCGSPLLMGATPPPLGSAACYSLFSGNGPVANSGISYARGDIGTNVTTTTGYDSSYVSGTIHPIPDGSTSACAADLLIAYNHLNLPGYDIELLYPAQFGSNLVLTPHTYLLNAATHLTDTVYLNAQGEADAVFIIKINGEFTTTTFAKVVLMNGAKASNVFWKVEGAVAISDSSEFEGTIVANNGAIDLQTGVKLNGRALTTNGALSTAAITATIPSGGCTTLPVNWLYFRGKQEQKNVLLQWSTTSEINNGVFTIEKSSDGRSFKTVGTVNATTGNTNLQHQYSLTDQQPYDLGYYRLSQTDKDGRRNYFRTILVKLNKQTLEVLPYVQGNYIYVQTSCAVPGNAFIKLFSIDGKEIFSRQIMLTKEINTHKISKPFQRGIYLVTIGTDKEAIYKGKLLVQ